VPSTRTRRPQAPLLTTYVFRVLRVKGRVSWDCRQSKRPANHRPAPDRRVADSGTPCQGRMDDHGIRCLTHRGMPRAVAKRTRRPQTPLLTTYVFRAPHVKGSRSRPTPRPIHQRHEPSCMPALRRCNEGVNRRRSEPEHGRQSVTLGTMYVGEDKRGKHRKNPKVEFPHRGQPSRVPQARKSRTLDQSLSSARRIIRNCPR